MNTNHWFIQWDESASLHENRLLPRQFIVELGSSLDVFPASVAETKMNMYNVNMNVAREVFLCLCIRLF